MSQSVRIRPLLAALFPLVLFAGPVAAGPKVTVGEQCGQAQRPSVAGVDHSPFDTLLRKYVDKDGGVDYAGWHRSAQDVRALDAYLASLGCVDRRKPATKAERLAFWINAYNAVTLRGILREYPTDSIRDHTAKLPGRYNIWKDLLLWVDNERHSLDGIEHQIIRKMGEPRIHFALVCAAKGCPPLRNEAYVAKKLDAQLADNSRKFLARGDAFRTDPARRTVYLSSILDWYGGDFANTDSGVLQAIKGYLPNTRQLGWITGASVRVKYTDYDWSLNSQR